MKNVTRLHSVGAVALLSALLLYLNLVSGLVNAESLSSLGHQAGKILTKITDTEHQFERLVLVGDLMLARNVEVVLYEKGFTYPYLGVKKVLTDSLAVANFEGAIPNIHKPTNDFGFKFSVSESVLEGLVASGFRYLSLANNHSADFGDDGYINTIDTLETRGFSAFGHSVIISTSSLGYANINGVPVSIININATYGYPTTSTIEHWLNVAGQNSEFILVYIHWGDEYELVSNQEQRQFGKFLIDHGAQLVVGHHPHVVQEIESYEGGLIFYSLGNFVFDQYFSSDVQVGLVLSLEFRDETTLVELIPVTSQYSRAQPQLMKEEEKADFLISLAEKSSPVLQDSIKGGLVALSSGIN